jgi:spermidine/putrescine transport system permease protein
MSSTHAGNFGDRHGLLLWLAPPLAWFVMFMLVPYGMLFYYSLGSVEYMTFRPGMSPANIVRVFSAAPYLAVLLKSLKLGMITAIGATVLGYPVAFCLAFHTARRAAKSFVYFLVIIPWWASYLVKAYAWKTILGSSGIINSLLMSLGAIQEPLTLLLYNQFSVALTLIYIFTPFAILSIYAQLERIPTSVIEAAKNLGASDFEIFRRIIMPLSLPGIVSGAVITFSLSFGDFVAPALVGGPDAVMISNIVVNLLGVAFDWPMAAAIGVVVLGFALALISFAQHLENRAAVRF